MLFACCLLPSFSNVSGSDVRQNTLTGFGTTTDAVLASLSLLPVSLQRALYTLLKTGLAT